MRCAEFLGPKLVLGKPCAPKPFGVADNARPGRAPGPQMVGFCTENLHFFKDLLVLCLSFPISLDTWFDILFQTRLLLFFGIFLV